MDAYAKSKTPKEARDKRATPNAVYNAVCDALNLYPVLDVCAENHTSKCEYHMTAEDDALSQDWRESVLDWGDGVCWMNPPYSDPYPWCEKAAEEAEKGAIVIGLLPDQRDAAWFREQCYPKANAIYTTNRRIAFLDENGEPQSGNPKCSVIVVWAPWRGDSPAQGYIDIPKPKDY